MRWIAASLFAINLLVLMAQFLMPGGAPAAEPARTEVPVRGDRLVLLSELAVSEMTGMVARKERARQAVQEAQQASQAMCTMVGPFPELLKAEYFAERLTAFDIPVSIQDIEIPGEVSYWIYLPPRESRKQAFMELRELQAKGIDSYVIPKGELANGISFGMFNQPTLARNRLEDMRSRGYPAELKEITRSFKETWVLLPSAQASTLSPETWLEMLATGENLERRQNFCPAVASE